MARTALIYLDPRYEFEFGHFTSMGRLIREEAERRGIELLHYVSDAVSPEQAEAEGLVRRFKFKFLSDLRDFHLRLDEILGELAGREERGACEIFMYTGDIMLLPGIALLLNKYRAALSRPRAHICLFSPNNRFCLKERGADLYEFMLEKTSGLIEFFDPDGLLTVCLESERGRQIYAPYFKRELKVLPLPIDECSGEPVEAGDTDTITIAYIGQASRRSGDGYVHRAYTELSKTAAFDSIRFKIKHNRAEGLDEEYLRLLRGSGNITFTEGFLSHRLYRDFISECDIVLVPYSRKDYLCKTSGIIVESLVRGKIVIVPEDTWMSDQIRDCGSGETFVSDDPDSFVEAVVKVVENFKDYKAGSSRGVEEYRALHSPAGFFSEIGLTGEVSAGAGAAEEGEPRGMDTGILEDLLFEHLVVLQERNRILQEKDRLYVEMDEQIRHKDLEIEALRDSLSWKVTALFRWVAGKLYRAS